MTVSLKSLIRVDHRRRRPGVTGLPPFPSGNRGTHLPVRARLLRWDAHVRRAENPSTHSEAEPGSSHVMDSNDSEHRG